MMVAYCTVYDIYVHGTGPRLSEALSWGIKEWGVWLIFAPMIMQTLRRIGRERIVSHTDFLQILVVYVIAALIYRVGLDRILQESPSVWVSLIMHTPRYIIGCLVVFIIWFLLKKKGVLDTSKFESKQTHSDRSGSPDQNGNLDLLNTNEQIAIEANNVVDDTLIVYCGNQKISISVASIVVATAARNYVELRCDSDNVYVIRSTLKQLEGTLSGDQFVRTHRSNIVNTSHIKRVKRLASGSGVLFLNCETEIPVSKRYLPSLVNDLTIK